MSPRAGGERNPAAEPSPDGHADAQPRARVRRVFVAIPLPEPARREVAALVDEVRAAGDPTARDVRWVRLDGLHLTLRFIGPIEDDHLAAVSGAVERAAAGLGSFEVAIEGAGAFPSTGRPRAIWLGVEEGSDELARAAAVLDDALAETGFERSQRPYRAHLTLARSDGIRAGPDVARRLIEAADGRRTTFSAGELVLFETVAGGGPARYVPITSAPLARAAVLEPERSPATAMIRSEPSVEPGTDGGPSRKEQGPGT